MNESSTGLWRVAVDALIRLRTGCHPSEQDGPQNVEVSVAAYAPIEAIQNPHRIENVVNYDVIRQAALGLEHAEHAQCLETHVLTLMDAVFALPAVSRVEIEMRKPHVYWGAAVPAIGLSLDRGQWAQLQGHERA